MIMSDFSQKHLYHGGIELSHKVHGGSWEHHNALAPQSLQDLEQLEEVTRVGQLALTLLGGLPSDTAAANEKDGMELQFITRLCGDAVADKFVPDSASELITARREPNVRTTVVTRRKLTGIGDSWGEAIRVPNNDDDIQQYLIRPLTNNLLIADVYRALAANPARRVEALKTRVAELEARLAEFQPIINLGGISLYYNLDRNS